MIRNNVNWTIKNLKAMVDNPNKDTLNFCHAIQRRSDIWDQSAASLLIHSVIMNDLYPIPSIFCLKELNENGKYVYSILDGKQRLSNIFKFINDEFALTNVPKSILDGEEYELENLYFSDLPTELQMEILQFKFRIYSFEPEEDDDEEFVNEVIEDIFFRLNSSVALSITDKSRALMGVSAINFLNTILKSKLFKESSKFSSNQIKKSDDLNTLLQACMLLDNKYTGYVYKNLSQKETSRYAEYLHNNFTDEMKQRLTLITEYLEKAFPNQEKMLKKINIPIIYLVADTAIGDYDPKNKRSCYRVGPNYFRRWFTYFFDECFEEYNQYCSSGSTRLDKTQGRIDTMLLSFLIYFEIEEENPEPDKTETLEETVILEEIKEPQKEMDVLEENSSISENDIPVDETVLEGNTSGNVGSDESTEETVVEEELLTDDTSVVEDTPMEETLPEEKTTE